MVNPVWSGDTVPDYHKRSDKFYVSDKISDIKERGFQSRILETMARVLPEGAVIAGGAVASAMLGEDIATDIDIFFTNSLSFEETYQMIDNVTVDTEDAWIFKDYKCDKTLDEIKKDWQEIRHVKFTHPDPTRKPIQLIKMLWYNDASHVIDSFDFTVCQFALQDEFIIYNSMGMVDLLKKRINIHKLQYPATSLRRLIKYTSKGYYASAEVLMKVAEDIRSYSELDPDHIFDKTIY